MTHITSVSVLLHDEKARSHHTDSNTHEFNRASNKFPVEIKHIKYSTSMGLNPHFGDTVEHCYPSKRLFVGIRTHPCLHYKYNVVTCFWPPPNVVWVIGSQNLSEHVYTRCPLKINSLAHLLHVCQCAGRPAPVSASRPPSGPPAGHWWWSASRCLYHQSQTDLCGSRTRQKTQFVWNKTCMTALKLI